MKSIPDFSIEREIGMQLIAGVDEAGRGPLCGPVVAAAVIFPSFDIEIPVKITDSKQMTHGARVAALEWIKQNTIWAVGQCSPVEIDELNILWASMLAMKRAIENLSQNPEYVLVDGNRLPDGIILDNRFPSGKRGAQRAGCRQKSIFFNDAPSATLPPLWSEGNQAATIYGRPIVKGDAKSLSIAAASIIAKETRDKIMSDLSAQFPQYGWDKNAGYPTASHLQAIDKYGINEHYRKSYRPIKERIENANSDN